MNRKNLNYWILAFLFIVVAVVLATQTKGTIKKELRDFAITDTSAVDKIFLVDKENHTILLERKKGYWSLNSSKVARQDLVDLLLKTMYRLQVKEPVSNAARENIIKSLAVKSTKVEIYQKGKLTKIYYVGGPTQDSYGTFMIIENSLSPFIVEIPGFRGYLSTRYSTLESDWKAQSVFNHSLDEMGEITFENFLHPGLSFRIIHQTNHFQLFTYPENNPISDFDTLEVKKYCMEFRKKNYSKYIDDVPQTYQDSIIETPPMYTLTLLLKNGTQKIVKAYNKPGWGRVDFFGQEMKNDPDHFFLLTPENEFVYAQYFVFDPLFKGIDTFLKD